MSMKNQSVAPVALIIALCIVAVGCSTTGSVTDDDAPGIAAECVEGVVDCDDTPSEGPTETLPPDPNQEPVVDPDLGGAVSVLEAAESGEPGPILVTGFYLNDGTIAQLCDLVLESYPPQCGGTSLIVTNPELLVDVPLIEEGDTQWSDGFVVVSAKVTGDQLTIASP